MLLDIYAPWCGSCKELSPILQESARELQSVRFVRIDHEEYSELSQKNNIRAFPTLILFGGDGTEVDRKEGCMTKKRIVI